MKTGSLLAVDKSARPVRGATYLCRHVDLSRGVSRQSLPILYVAHNMSHDFDLIRYSQSARKHRIGKASADYVIRHNSPNAIQPEPLKLLWVGFDERKRELEIIAVLEEHELIIIHVMPTIYRRGKKDE